MTAPLDFPVPDMMDVTEAARRIVMALRARRAFVAFPAHNVRQVRLLRYLPRAVSDWMAYRHLLRTQKK